MRLLSICPVLLVLLSLPLLAPAAGATKKAATGSFFFASARKTGDIDRVDIVLEVGGDLKTIQDNKVSRMKMKVVGKFEYDEKTIEIAESSQQRCRAVRAYEKTTASIQVDGNTMEPTLRDDRRLIGVETDQQSSTLYALQGNLTREELELVDIFGNSLLLDRFLPQSKVAVGDSWQHSSKLLAVLLGLDRIAKSEVRSKLTQVTDSFAMFEMSGKVEGAIGGVSTEIELKAKYRFILSTMRIDWIGLIVKEQRSIGHVQPGLEAVAKLQMKIAPQQHSSRLTETSLEDLPLEATEEFKRLVYRAPKGEWSIVHDRNWHVTSEQPDLTVFRLLDHGELVAQCNVALMPSVEAGAPIDLTKFQESVRQALGESFGQFVHAKQWADEAEHQVSRVEVRGTASEMPIQWNYYLIGDKLGHRLVCTFTVQADLLERLSKADEKLVETVRFMAPTVATQGSPNQK